MNKCLILLSYISFTVSLHGVQEVETRTQSFCWNLCCWWAGGPTTSPVATATSDDIITMPWLHVSVPGGTGAHKATLDPVRTNPDAHQVTTFGSGATPTQPTRRWGHRFHTDEPINTHPEAHMKSPAAVVHKPTSGPSAGSSDDTPAVDLTMPCGHPGLCDTSYTFAPDRTHTEAADMDITLDSIKAQMAIFFKANENFRQLCFKIGLATDLTILTASKEKTPIERMSAEYHSLLEVIKKHQRTQLKDWAQTLERSPAWDPLRYFLKEQYDSLVSLEPIVTNPVFSDVVDQALSLYITKMRGRWNEKKAFNDGLQAAGVPATGLERWETGRSGPGKAPMRRLSEAAAEPRVQRVQLAESKQGAPLSLLFALFCCTQSGGTLVE